VAERRGSAAAVLPALALTALLLLSPPASPARAAAPTLPIETGRGFLVQLALAPVAPGGSTNLQFTLDNPLASTLTGVTLEFGFYAFDPSPGGHSEAVPAEGPTLSSGTAATERIRLSVGTLLGRSSGWSAPVTVSVPGSAPLGTYALSDDLNFTTNGTSYRLASIGNFPTSLWDNATLTANGTPTLNLTRLGVSGILPETALLVQSSTAIDVALYGLGGAAVVFAIAGGYVAMRRRGPSSRSGASSAPEESHAASALGKS
jgi:hypothetical protein